MHCMGSDSCRSEAGSQRLKIGSDDGACVSSFTVRQCNSLTLMQILEQIQMVIFATTVRRRLVLGSCSMDTTIEVLMSSVCRTLPAKSVSLAW